MNQEVCVLGPKHNDALLSLAAECMGFRGRTSFKVDRSPDYFAFLRTLPGEVTVLGVLDGKSVVATVSLIKRQILYPI